MRVNHAPFGFRTGVPSVLALSSVLLLSCVQGPKGPDTAKRMRALVPAIPEAWSDEPVVVLADSVSIRFKQGEDGNQVLHRQVTWCHVSRRSPNLLENGVVADHQSIEQSPVIRVSAWYPDGSSWSASPLSDIVRVRFAPEGLHSSDRHLSAWRLPRYVQGMLIRTEVSRTYRKPEFLKSELLRGELPVLSKVVSLALPEGAAVRHAFTNPEGIQADTVRAREPGSLVFTVSAQRLPKLEARSMPREPEAWYAALHFSLPPRGLASLSWSELGDAYLAAIAQAFETTPELERLAAGLPGGPGDSLVTGAYSLLRARIRYHADMGLLHTFVPRKAGVVLEKGYGDCKEMSTLLAQIMRRRGQKVGVALVSTAGVLQVSEGYPSLGGFNHMIVWAEGPGGLRFYDPTVKHGDPADSYFDLIGRKALVLREGASALMAIPMGPGFRNRVETRNAVRKGPAGKDWSLTGTIRLEGHCAFSLLPALNAAVGEERGPMLKAWLKQLFALEAREARLVSAGARAIEIGYAAPFDANYLHMDKGGLLLAGPSLYGGDVRYTLVDAEGPRHVARIEQSDTWEIPTGFEDLEKADLDHGLGRGSWSRKGGLVRRDYSAGESVVPADRRQELSEWVKRKHKFARATVWHR